ncbi:hypothetical protein POVCU1_081430 [Plasmodium ovale curtisi]|uniref:Uncharacterized protein n=1 Tax=Plasmodium ovale curtisi TaxID=864141 RepID=A0A1A8XES1_PLAOA|nr:hypothetical protein POVCU1_081430 [Plasmodium ovale curtisi]
MGKTSLLQIYFPIIRLSFCARYMELREVFLESYEDKTYIKENIALEMQVNDVRVVSFCSSKKNKKRSERLRGF